MVSCSPPVQCQWSKAMLVQGFGGQTEKYTDILDFIFPLSADSFVSSLNLQCFET